MLWWKSVSPFRQGFAPALRWWQQFGRGTFYQRSWCYATGKSPFCWGWDDTDEIKIITSYKDTDRNQMMKDDETRKQWEVFRLGCRMLFLTMPFLWRFLWKSSVAGTDSSVGWSLRADGAGQTKASSLWFGLELRCFCGSIVLIQPEYKMVFLSQKAFKSLWDLFIFSFFENDIEVLQGVVSNETTP